MAIPPIDGETAADASDPSPRAPARSSDRLAYRLLLATAGGYAAHAIAAVAVGRHLYGDAAWFFVRVVTDGRAFALVQDFPREFFRSRAVALWLTQAPTVLALRLGIQDFSVLSTILGCTYFGSKLASLAICYRLLPAGEKLLFVFPALGLFAGSINSDVYIVSEVHVAVSFAWPILLALRREASAGRLRDGLLGLAILATCLIHEGFVAIAGLMLAWVLGRRLAGGRDPRAVWLSALLALTVAVNALAVVFPRDPTQKGLFVDGLRSLASDTLRGVRTVHVGPLVSAVAVLAILAVTLTASREARSWRSGPVVATGLFLAVAPLLLARSFAAHPRLGHAVTDRAFAGVAMQLLLMGAYLAVDAFRREAFHRRAAPVAALLGALAFGQLTHQLFATRVWWKATRNLRERLAAASGLLHCPEPRGSAAGRWTARTDEVLCGWAVTPLSVILSRASGTAVRSIMISDDGVAAYDGPTRSIRNAGDLQELAIGGRFVPVDYGPYLSAVRSAVELVPSEKVFFGAAGHGAALLRDGFSRPEEDGAWTDGQRATVRPCGLATPPDASVRLVFHVQPLEPPGGQLPEAAFSVGGAPWGTWRFSPGGGVVEREVILPGSAIPSGGCVELGFEIGNARAPGALGLPWDERRLGLRFVDLQRL